MIYDPANASHCFVTEPGVLPEVTANARRRQTITGRPEWIHHHPHAHLCDHRCGPVDQAPTP